jgi:hypothetical protein
MIEDEVQKLPEALQEAGREVLTKLDEYFHEPVIVKLDECSPWMWAFAIQTHLPPPEAQTLFDQFFFEYWYEVDNPKRLEGILVTLEYLTQ